MCRKFYDCSTISVLGGEKSIDRSFYSTHSQTAFVTSSKSPVISHSGGTTSAGFRLKSSSGVIGFLCVIKTTCLFEKVFSNFFVADSDRVMSLTKIEKRPLLPKLLTNIGVEANQQK